MLALMTPATNQRDLHACFALRRILYCGNPCEYCFWYLRRDARWIITIKYEFKYYLPFILSSGIKVLLIDFER